MASEVTVFVCDTQKKALTARSFLLSGGYTSDEIVVQERAAVFVYDADTHNGGGNESELNKWIVIGCKS